MRVRERKGYKAERLATEEIWIMVLDPGKAKVLGGGSRFPQREGPDLGKSGNNFRIPCNKCKDSDINLEIASFLTVSSVEKILTSLKIATG